MGTNVLSSGDGIKERLPFNRSVFVSNYVSFVRNVRKHYPTATILLLSSPMVHGDKHEVLVESLLEVKNRLLPDIEVEFFDLEPFVASGCTGHPSIEDHQRIAESLLPTFRTLLDLEPAEN